jgi:hypothetical protein
MKVYNFGHDYYSKLGWIPYNSFLGSRNRDDVEPSQAQINTMYDLNGISDKWDNIFKIGR